VTHSSFFRHYWLNLRSWSFVGTLPLSTRSCSNSSRWHTETVQLYRTAGSRYIAPSLRRQLHSRPTDWLADWRNENIWICSVVPEYTQLLSWPRNFRIMWDLKEKMFLDMTCNPGDSKFLRHVTKFIPVYMSSHLHSPRRETVRSQHGTLKFIIVITTACRALPWATFFTSHPQNQFLFLSKPRQLFLYLTVLIKKSQNK
jgi:hypothetical protein